MYHFQYGSCYVRCEVTYINFKTIEEYLSELECGQTEGLADKQTDWRTDRRTGRQTDRETECINTFQLLLKRKKEKCTFPVSTFDTCNIPTIFRG